MRNDTSGFTLLEVLVAVLIVSLGMLGIGAALATVHRSTSSSYLQQQSVQLASDIIERMRQNDTAAQTFDYNIVYAGGIVAPPAVMCDQSGVACSGAELATYDLWQWRSSVNSLLPGGTAKVAVVLTPANTYEATVTVTYNDRPAATALKSGATTRTVQLETLL